MPIDPSSNALREHGKQDKNHAILLQPELQRRNGLCLCHPMRIRGLRHVPLRASLRPPLDAAIHQTTLFPKRGRIITTIPYYAISRVFPMVLGRSFRSIATALGQLFVRERATPSHAALPEPVIINKHNEEQLCPTVHAAQPESDQPEQPSHLGNINIVIKGTTANSPMHHITLHEQEDSLLHERKACVDLYPDVEEVH